MNENEIKKHLIDHGLKVSDLATEMAKTFNLEKTSADSMLRQMISGQRWYPRYADWLRETYNITINKPEWAKPVRERLKLQAA